MSSFLLDAVQVKRTMVYIGPMRARKSYELLVDAALPSDFLKKSDNLIARVKLV